MGFEVKCVPVLDKMPCCCCSCDLKVATCVLGWLGFISNIGSFLRGAIGLAVFEESKEALKDVSDTREALITTLVVAAIGIVLMSLLLYGAHNEKPGFMLPFLIADMIGLVVWAAVALIAGIWLCFYTIGGLLVILISGLFIALGAFFWVVIYSYYRKLEESKYPFQATSLGNDVKG